MNHLTEEELVLYYYGEAGEAREIERHLHACETCREAYGGLQRVLNVVESYPVPECSENYGRQVWERLAIAPRRFRRPSWRRWAAAVAMAALVVAAFLAGRYSPGPRPRQQAANPQQVRERILLVALGDHLDRSEMVLIELANADPRHGLDISDEQQRADALISENRLYRQTAARTGDTAVAGVLDELERVLLDIARGPSHLTPADLERIRQRIRVDGILFKVRVIGSTVERKEERAVPGAAGKRL
jgi:hypothetical protein